MATIRALLLALLAFASGCSWNVAEKNEDPVRRILGCSAGVLLSYNVSADVGTDLRSKIGAGAGANEAVRGYIFALLPEQQRLEGYKLYLACMEQPADASAVHARLFPLIERSQHLWDNFVEAQLIGTAIPLGEADRYAQVAGSLKALSEEGFNRRSALKRSDREALMFFLAAEILVRSRERSPELAAKARQHSQDAYGAALHTRSLYDAFVKNPGGEGDWAQWVDVRETVLNRLADAQAQMAFLTGETKYLKELDGTLELLPCGYFRKYRTAEDPMYRRIPVPRRIRHCEST